MSADGRCGVDDPPEVAWLLCLASLPRMGPRRLDGLVAGRDPASVWSDIVAGARRVDAEVIRRCGAEWTAVRTGWVTAAQGVDPASVWEAHRGRAVLDRTGAGFPARLVDDPEPPAFLVVEGTLPEHEPVVSIVGTRRCTGYGRDVARSLGRDLAEAGVVVASGLALGIDAAAHTGALEVDGAPPLGVVATGLDLVYPARNRHLWEQVAARGALMSEHPLGTAPTRWRFPARNRILAGMADAVVVVESHAGGGSMHTVASALDRDVPVLTIPGPVTSPASAGTNRLLVDGAVPVRDIDDVLTVLGLSGRRRSASMAADPARVEVPEAGLVVLGALDATPTTVDTVALRTGRPLRALHAELVELERRGLAAQEAGWWRVSPLGQLAAAVESPS
ncbi:MAG: DNA-protecting protein DprA [Actinomycetota bacterium]